MSVHKIRDTYYVNDDSHPIYEVDTSFVEEHVVLLVVESKNLDSA